MDVPVRFIDSIINNPLLMQFLVHRWFFLLEYDPRLDQLRVYDTRSRTLETLDAYLGSEKPEHATIFAEDRWKMRALLTGELYGPLEMRFVSPEGVYYSREVDARPVEDPARGTLYVGYAKDCRTKDASRRELYIVEGDSAMGAVKQSRDSEYQAIMPIRGKILNCLKADYARIFKSDVIVDLIKVMGCGVELGGKHNKELATFNIETAYELYKQYGCERYVEMLHIINEAWKGNVDSYLAGVIRGVARFISVYEGEYSRERLVQQLARTHPKTITQLAQKDTGSSANRHMR